MLTQEKIEIDREDAHQLLEWWGLANTFAGQELAKRLEDFVTSTQD